VNNDEMRRDGSWIEDAIEDIAHRWLHGGPRAARMTIPIAPQSMTPLTAQHRWVAWRRGMQYPMIVLLLVRENGRINIREERTREIVASVSIS
jgi:hypothetical protein